MPIYISFKYLDKGDKRMGFQVGTQFVILHLIISRLKLVVLDKYWLYCVCYFT